MTVGFLPRGALDNPPFQCLICKDLRQNSSLRDIEMRKQIIVALAVAASIFAAASLSFAHHSGNNYDSGRQITLQGTVTEFKLVNPHPLLYFTVKGENGKDEEWFAESALPPFRWYNNGWRADSLKVGDSITVTGSPSKDSRKRLQLRKFVDASGREGPGTTDLRPSSASASR